MEDKVPKTDENKKVEKSSVQDEQKIGGESATGSISGSSSSESNSVPLSDTPSDSPLKKVPNPLLQLKVKGNLDLLDEDDLLAHLEQSYALALFKTCNTLRGRNHREDRLQEYKETFDVTFSISIQDLIDFKCSRKDQKDAAEWLEKQEDACIFTEAQGHPCFNFPFMKNEKFNKRMCIPFLSQAVVTRNDFRGVMTEDLKIGSTISENYLEVQQHLQRSMPITNYLVKKDQNILTFNVLTSFPVGEKTGKRWNILPMITIEEMERICRTAFIDREHTIDKGVVKYKLGDNTYCYLPDEHGMSQEIKRYMPSVVSTVRVYASQIGVNNCKLFLRLPERCYEDAKARLIRNDLNSLINRECYLKNICFWIGHKEAGEKWIDPEEKQRLSLLPEEERTRKRKVILKVDLCWLELNLVKEDWFWSDKLTLGAFLPGPSYVDGIINRQAELTEDEKKAEYLPEKAKTLRVLPEINARSLPYYLKENLVERKQIKEGRENPKQLLTYKEKLLEQ